VAYLDESKGRYHVSGPDFRPAIER